MALNQESVLSTPVQATPERSIEDGEKSEGAIKVEATPSEMSSQSDTQPVPLSWKLMSVVLVTMIGQHLPEQKDSRQITQRTIS